MFGFGKIRGAREATVVDIVTSAVAATQLRAELGAIFAVDSIGDGARESIRRRVNAYVTAVRQEEVPPERALILVKEMVRDARSAAGDQLPRMSASSAVGFGTPTFMRDSRQQETQLLQQVVPWAIAAYYNSETTAAPTDSRTVIPLD